MNKAGTNAGRVQERTRLANTALNSCAFVAQTGTTGASPARILRLGFTSDVFND